MAEDRASQVKQVKEANDIVEVVGSYVTLRQNGKTYKGLCPFHDDHRPSFDVDPQRQRYRCWSCGKHGDVFLFIQEHERVDFREALELLARRAGISLEKSAGFGQNHDRAAMLDLTRWAAEQFHQCLLDSPLAESARLYLEERHVSGETTRRFGLGFAPLGGTWLTQRAVKAGHSFEMMEKLGLCSKRTDGSGWFDRFRDRVMFPIRDAQGRPRGFGGRILPSSPLLARSPKYYNSTDTPVFTKSEHLYGLDQARQAGASAGYLAVVEGYTDVLMAHQAGVAQVVATMGTALNERHVRNLRRYVPRVVLVFDADTGGNTGVDRALEIFVSQEVDLAIATLPEGMDPCDLLVQQGPEPFRKALEVAVDALEFKLNQVFGTVSAGTASISARHQALDAVLKVIALSPVMTGQSGTVKRELILSRIAQRLHLELETVWARLRELRSGIASRDRKQSRPESEAEKQPAVAPPAHEQELLQVLLAEPALVPVAATGILPSQFQHPDTRRLLEELYTLQAAKGTADIDRLRGRLDDPRLTAIALDYHELGRANSDRPAWLRQIMAEFRKRQAEPVKRELQNQLHAANDHTEAVELLRRLQQRKDF